MNVSELLARAKPDDERATSPTVGSVLLVGVTVMLASTVGAQMYGMTDAEQRPFAVAPVEYDTADDAVTVTWMANSNAEQLQVTVHVDGRQRAVTLNEVGETMAVDSTGLTVHKGDRVHWETPSIADGEDVTVVVSATKDGNTVVLSEHTRTV